MVMGGVYCDLGGKYFVWSSPLSSSSQLRIVSFNNLKGNITINDLELGTLLLQILLFYRQVAPLQNIRTYVENMAAQGWAT